MKSLEMECFQAFSITEIRLDFFMFSMNNKKRFSYLQRYGHELEMSEMRA